MSDHDLQDKPSVDDLLLRCAVPPQTQGFDFLAEAVCLYSTKRYKNISDVYAEIGKSRGLSASTVHRYADYSLSRAKHAADVVNELFGTHYTNNDIHNKLLVALLAQFIRMNKSDDINKDDEPEDDG